MTKTPWKNFLPPANSLNGRVILITGAGSGIGATLAVHCAKQGAEILLLGRNQESLENVYDTILAEGGKEPGICLFDLLNPDEAAYEELASQIKDSVGHIDAVVHNAGLLGKMTPISSYRADIWKEVMQVNLHANFMLTKSLLPLLEESDAGRIIFTTSGAGRQGQTFMGAYSVSKFAIEGLNQVLAAELDGVAPITVNAINPGPTRTKIHASAYPAKDPGTVTAPEELMSTYLFFLGRESDGYSGLSVNAQ